MLRVFCACVGVALVLLAAEASMAQNRPARPPGQTQAPSSPVRTMDPAEAAKPIEAAPVAGAPADAERRAAEIRTPFNDQLVIYAALLVAVGSFLVIAFGVQAFYVALGLRLMQRTAGLSERNAIASQRAFIYVGDFAWHADGTVVEISPTWVNSGSTPTRRLQINTNWKAAHGELRPEIDINYVKPPDGQFLGPGAKVQAGTVVVPMRDIQAALEERLQIFVWGRAVYEDMFEGTKPHFFDFCHRVEVTGEAPGKIKLHFRQYGRSNGSDEDVQSPDEAAA
jgi:hypothetical protein